MADKKQTPAGVMTARELLIEQLAPLVLADRQAEEERAANDRHAPRPYYMLNLNHPTVRRMYLAYLKKGLHGDAPGPAPSDVERTRFELAMLHPVVLQQLAKEYRAADDGQARTLL